MLAFYNDQAIKDKYLSRVRLHRAADEIVKGQYWEGGKGCAVGCTVHSSDHLAYETELGIPRIIARLEDRIFENLPNELAMTWPERFLDAIPVGKDLSRVWPKFAIFLLTDPTQCNSRHEQCGIVAGHYQTTLDGGTVDWFAAAAAADAYAASAYAAAAAADAAADAAAASAAYAAAAAYAYAAYAYAASAAAAAAAADAAAAAAAADAAAAAYAYRSAKEKAYIAQSEKLLELLAEVE